MTQPHLGIPILRLLKTSFRGIKGKVFFSGGWGFFLGRGGRINSTAISNKGEFTSPNDEPLGKPIGVRLPASLEAWISEEAEKQGINKGNLIRRLLAETKFYRTQHE